MYLPLPICPTWHMFPFFHSQVQTVMRYKSILISYMLITDKPGHSMDTELHDCTSSSLIFHSPVLALSLPRVLHCMTELERRPQLNYNFSQQEVSVLLAPLKINKTCLPRIIYIYLRHALRKARQALPLQYTVVWCYTKQLQNKPRQDWITTILNMVEMLS